MKNKPTGGIIAITLGVLTALIPIAIFPVCADMIELIDGQTLFMKCHWTAMAEILVGILIVFNGILMIVFKKHEARVALSIMLFLLGLATLLLPTAVIGMCEAAAAPCRMATQPALIVVSVTTMSVGIGNTLIHSSLIKKEAQ
jgi:hypothetical protein